MAETEKMTLLGYHFPFPGVGHITREKHEFVSLCPQTYELRLDELCFGADERQPELFLI